MVRFNKKTLLLLLGVSLVFTSCALHKGFPETTAPERSEILSYDLPFDLVYLRTLEALDSINDWQLEETDKEKGIIKLRNIEYGKLPDPDTRLAVILIKRITRNKTSVELAPESQHLLGTKPLLKRISEYLSGEL